MLFYFCNLQAWISLRKEHAHHLLEGIVNLEQLIVRAATTIVFLINWFLANDVMANCSKKIISAITRNTSIRALKEQNTQRN